MSWIDISPFPFLSAQILSCLCKENSLEARYIFLIKKMNKSNLLLIVTIPDVSINLFFCIAYKNRSNNILYACLVSMKSVDPGCLHYYTILV